MDENEVIDRILGEHGYEPDEVLLVLLRTLVDWHVKGKMRPGYSGGRAAGCSILEELSSRLSLAARDAAQRKMRVAGDEVDSWGPAQQALAHLMFECQRLAEGEAGVREQGDEDDENDPPPPMRLVTE